MLQKWKKEMRRASEPEARRASGPEARRASGPEEEGEIDGVYTQEVYFAEDGSHCTVDYDNELEEIGDACFPKVNLKFIGLRDGEEPTFEEDEEDFEEEGERHGKKGAVQHSYYVRGLIHTSCQRGVPGSGGSATRFLCSDDRS